nr:MAG TPA: hypothetical protein [Bacteriophage sp.]
MGVQKLSIDLTKIFKIILRFLDLELVLTNYMQTVNTTSVRCMY